MNAVADGLSVIAASGKSGGSGRKAERMGGRAMVVGPTGKLLARTDGLASEKKEEAGRASVSESEFAARVSETRAVVFRVAYSVVRDRADAEEIAQDTFLRAHGRMGSLRESEKFHAWVCRIAFRLALNHRRARGRSMARDTAWHGSRATVTDGARAEAGREYLTRLREEIERLPKKLRAVVLLASVAGMEAVEVAEVLEIPAGTVRSRLVLARKKLLEVMGR
ncbi:MAG TPA: RNA polymerase sigma factor [Candidatus Acidoferrales bacterium]|nr:RNA polymerase sigma factor [Candidatus Acidoferrales bacterium]